jgi:large subunit ribosomal protein L3
MYPAILGKKVGMTQVYDERGVLVPVTVIEAGPCTVTQVKTKESEGYDALQLGFGVVKPSRRTKPLIGHFKKAKAEVPSFIREVRTEEGVSRQVGEQLTVAEFAEIKYVDVIGTSKGKGFQGFMKRHHFKGQPASHGCERKHRSPGSIAGPAGSTGRGVKKGKRMSGHMGHEQSTSQNHRVIVVDTENNLLLIKGAVAGPTDGYVIVSRAKTRS